MTRILVVEDSPTQAERVRLILEGEGFDVETVRDGQEGREKLEASVFDLVVSDIERELRAGSDCLVVADLNRRTESHIRPEGHHEVLHGRPAVPVPVGCSDSMPGLPVFRAPSVLLGDIEPSVGVADTGVAGESS